MIISRPFAFVIGLPILAIYEIIRYLKVKSLEKRFISYREISVIIFFFYLIELVSLTVFPLKFNQRLESVTDTISIYLALKSVLAAPSGNLGVIIKYWVVSILGKFILLLPLATILPIINVNYRNFKSMIFLCIFISILIQSIPILLGSTTLIDLIDLALNILGAILGYFIFKLIKIKYLPEI